MRSLRAPPSTQRLLLVWAAVVVVLSLAGLPTAEAQRTPRALRRCQRPPRFAVNSVEPMALTNGRVTVVALLTHTCGFCQRQAASLDALQREYLANGSDVSTFIVNGGRAGPGEYGVDIPVYQDDADEQLWRSVFRGGKDDIFIFNRCGMLTYRIGMPYSYLGFNYVRRAIHNSLHNHMICPQCQNHGLSDPHDVMMGDAPVASSSVGMHGQGRRGEHRGRSGHRHGNQAMSHGNGSPGDRRTNRSRCPRNDELCKELRRERRRWNRLRRQRGMGHLSEEQAVRIFGSLQSREVGAL